ncbi:unnamed protein product [Phyllotreta striolata]|uniref:Uncharacterized protein n=1 Tax=Phyllotreta striolata TaxID=444603 RepID=A0A9N9TPV7_PHYSR|nr:unnamed protein product [Phyllotreta striolata]
MGFKCKLLFLILVISYSVILTECCRGLEDVTLTIKDKTGIWSNLTVSACIERKILNGLTATEIYVKNQYLPTLGKDFVRHLVKLHTLKFQNCSIKSILPGAFRNLPSIWLVEISHNPKLTLIQGGIFDIFDTIHILRLNNNNINTITDEALSNMTLTEVDFSYNNFSEFNPVWFAYSPRIRQLNFRNNRITKIPKTAFEDMMELETIEFQNNKIYYIGSGAFRRLKSLKLLNLSNNRLKSIGENVFPGKLTVETLNIAGNYLHDIPTELLEKLIISEIYLDYNYFFCSCYNTFMRYFAENDIKVRKEANCYSNYLPVCLVSGTACQEPPPNTPESRKIEELSEKLKTAYRLSRDNDKDFKCT